MAILRHPSLSVSIPILHCWSKLLQKEAVWQFPALHQQIGPLLETCSERLVRYESLPTDSEEPAVLFLNEDIDTIPEKHAFLGNYRRYCSDIVQTIVLQKPMEAVPHILSQTESALNSLYVHDARPQRKLMHRCG